MVIDIFKLLTDLFALLLIFRFLLQLVQANFFNPLSQAVLKTTAPVVEPLHKICPTIRNLNTAALMGAIISKWLYYWIILASGKLLYLGIGAHFFVAIFDVLGLVTEIYFWGIVIIALASWLQALHHPHVRLLGEIVEPYLNPFRRIIPPIGILDLSSMVAIITLLMIQARILPLLKSMVLQFF